LQGLEKEEESPATDKGLATTAYLPANVYKQCIKMPCLAIIELVLAALPYCLGTAGDLLRISLAPNYMASPDGICHHIIDFELSNQGACTKHHQQMDRVTEELWTGYVLPANVIVLPLAEALTSETLTMLLSSFKLIWMTRDATSGGALKMNLEAQKLCQLLLCVDFLLMICSTDFFSSSSERSSATIYLNTSRRKQCFCACSSLHVDLLSRRKMHWQACSGEQRSMVWLDSPLCHVNLFHRL
jgi:hypothetical protein